ncbi:MAG: hypothetical protein IJZ19_06040 [Lentisphaeria bacterium]|nr:hypothetical protein [Lentisphaeria bacterium]
MIEPECFNETDKAAIRRKLTTAVKLLKNNIRPFEKYPEYRLLIAGDTYPGIWLEHNQDNYFLADYDPETAWNSIRFFMARQREDGLLPFMTLTHEQSQFWHLQTVWAFTRCAYEIAKKINRPKADLEQIYRVGAAYDLWLEKKRDRSGSGLVEMYCEWDTGHDNDKRVTDGGIPQTCPGNDAANMPDLEVMPILSVDLSCMRYGNLDALAELAEALGMTEEAKMQREKAIRLQEKIEELLYCEEDEFYYDRSPQGFRKYRTEHITRVFLNRVCSQERFDRIYKRYFENKDEFAAPWPYPSVSLSDPSFDHTYPRNSWGSNSQVLTALRAMLWLDYYGRPEEKRRLLLRWMRALLAPDNPFVQELHPLTGKTPTVIIKGGYTPSLLLFLLGAGETGIEIDY